MTQDNLRKDHIAVQVTQPHRPTLTIAGHRIIGNAILLGRNTVLAKVCDEAGLLYVDMPDDHALAALLSAAYQRPIAAEDRPVANIGAAAKALVKGDFTVAGDLLNSTGLPNLPQAGAERLAQADALLKAGEPVGDVLEKFGMSTRTVIRFDKAAADDPVRPGYPAGTEGGKGGKYRPKDDGGGAGSTDPSVHITMTPGTIVSPDQPGERQQMVNELGLAPDGLDDLAKRMKIDPVQVNKAGDKGVEALCAVVTSRRVGPQEQGQILSLIDNLGSENKDLRKNLYQRYFEIQDSPEKYPATLSHAEINERLKSNQAWLTSIDAINDFKSDLPKKIVKNLWFINDIKKDRENEQITFFKELKRRGLTPPAGVDTGVKGGQVTLPGIPTIVGRYIHPLDTPNTD